ncbi:MAG: DUF4421 domain-containing protein [Bacteroidota bacterium]
MRNFLLCSLFLISAFCCFGQVSTTVSKKKEYSYDTNYYVSYYNKLALKLYGVVKSNRISIFDDFTDNRINYEPNDRFNLGFGFSYKWANLDIALNFPFINDDDDVFGETSRFDAQGNLYLRKFIIDANYQRYSGYYVENPETYIPNFQPDPSFPIRSDISTFSIGIQSFYLFNNEHLSLRSSFLYNERQKRSAGSFIMGPYFLFFRLEADESIIPEEIRTQVNSVIDFSTTRFINAGLNFGYVHTFVIKKRFFITPFVAVGFGTETRASNALERDLELKETIFSPNVSGRFAVGYNSDLYFVGFSILAETTGDVASRDPLLEYSINTARLFIGRRLEAPKFLKPKKKRRN